MRIVVDSSTLISLAWSGQLELLARLPVIPVVIRSVYDETVTAGRDRGHADAVSIEHALTDVEPADDEDAPTVDAMVLAAAIGVGAIATNDVVLGRRARNLGVRWLRTADLVVLGRATLALDAATARRAVDALAEAGRLTPALHDAYMTDLAELEAPS